MKFTLSKPLNLSSGETVSELNLDFSLLTLVDIKNARKVKAFIADNTLGEVDNSTVSPRLDPDLRIGMAWVSAVKGDKRLTLNDVLLLSAKDALELSEVTLTEYLF